MHRRYNLAYMILASVVAWSLTPLMVEVDAQAQIAFVSHRDGNAEIYVMDADGGNQRNLSNNPNKDSSPSWSPDSKRIAFSSWKPEDWEGIEIYVMDTDGDNQRKLTNNRHPDDSPVWSPDGERIAFESWRDENWEIYVMDADGGNQRNLTKHGSWDTSPAWYTPALAVSATSKISTMWGWLKQVDR